MNLRNSMSLSLVILFSQVTIAMAANPAGKDRVSEEVKAQALVNYGKLPLSFEENRGQTDARVKFLSHGSDYSIRLAPSEVLLNLRSAGRARHESAVRMSFPGAQASPVMAGIERQDAISSYFIGNNPAKWVTGAPNFGRVRYGELYHGVDVAFYGHQGQLEYDFMVAPGANPRAIRLQFDGVEGIHLDRAGDLIVSAANGEIRQHKPMIYQEGAGGRKIVEGQYVIQAHNRVAFAIAPYDKHKPLVIDPTLTFGTYLGSKSGDLYQVSAAASTATYPAVALDMLGNVYISGYMGGNAPDFPGPPKILAGLGGGTHVFVVKMNPTGTALLYSVVFGGESIDITGGIAADNTGNAYVTGSTTSPHFPVTAGAPQSSLNGGTNAFVTKVNATGTALGYSTYLGGSGTFLGNAIAVDGSGNAYVTGTAEASGSTLFPLVNPISSTPSAGFLTEVNAGGTGFAYSTYLTAGIGYGIALDSNGDAYVTGSTGSMLAPSPARGYVVKVNTGGTGLGYSGVPVVLGNAGGSLQTIGFGIALDAGDNAYVTGMTNDPSFPQITPGAAQGTYGGGLTDAFAVKLNSAGGLVYGTYIGGLGSNVLPERGSGIGVDLQGTAYVSGTTQCIGVPGQPGSFPTVNPISGARNGGPSVLRETTDSGSTWLATTPILAPRNFDQVTALAFDGSNLYAGASAFKTTTGGGVYKLVNGTWTYASSGITSTTIDSIAVDPITAPTVYAAGGGHLFQTTTGGIGTNSWTLLTTSSYVVGTPAMVATAKTGSSSRVVYVGSSNGLIYSTTPGTSSSWTTPVTAPGAGAVNALVVDPNSPNQMTAYAGTPTGVYKTTDGGAHWTAVNAVSPTGSLGIVTSLAISTSTIYAATPNGLYYTKNAGTNWTQATLGTPLPIARTPLLVAVDAVNNVYVAFEGAGMATGTNGGTQPGDWGALTYTDLTQNQIVALAVPPGSSGTAYAGIVSATTAFLTEISPNGQSFLSSTCIGGSDNNLGQGVAVTPGGAVYVSGATIATDFPATPGAVQTSNAGLYDAFVVGVYTKTAVTITSSPSAASITVAGSGCAPGSYTTPANLAWSAGGVCTISCTDPQIIGGVEYEFQSSTVNGSAVSHTNPLTVNSGGGTLSINAVFGAVRGTGPGTATHLSVTAPSNATVGIPVQFTVTALDANNNIATTYTDPVHFSSTDSSATLPADATLINGVGTFSASLVTAGGISLTATDLLTPTITGTSASIVVSPAPGLRFVSMPPCRVVDTRDGTKPSGFGPPFIAGGATLSFSIPNGPCSGVQPIAQAYSLNVTVVPHTGLGYITVWPTGRSRPLASTLNSLDGRVKANAAIVPAGSGGAISVFATNDTDVILDINGYFVPATSSTGLGFYAMTPCRLVDTRPGAPSTISTGALTGGSSRTLEVLASSCQVPAVAQAYSLNFTLVPPGAVGYLTVYPTGESRPIVSTLNDPTGTVEANAAIAPAGSGGSIDVFVTNTTDVVVDINGYFAPVAAGALSLYTLPPCRVLDTRSPAGTPPFVGALDVNVIGSGCGGTTGGQAYVFNATVVPSGMLGYLTLWPQGGVRPLASTLNAYDGSVTSNMAIVPTSNTEVSAFVTNNTYLILDLFGYFAP